MILQGQIFQHDAARRSFSRQELDDVVCSWGGEIESIWDVHYFTEVIFPNVWHSRRLAGTMATKWE